MSDNSSGKPINFGGIKFNRPIVPIANSDGVPVSNSDGVPEKDNTSNDSNTVKPVIPNFSKIRLNNQNNTNNKDGKSQDNSSKNIDGLNDDFEKSIDPDEIIHGMDEDEFESGLKNKDFNGLDDVFDDGVNGIRVNHDGKEDNFFNPILDDDDEEELSIIDEASPNKKTEVKKFPIRKSNDYRFDNQDNSTSGGEDFFNPILDDDDEELPVTKTPFSRINMGTLEEKNKSVENKNDESQKINKVEVNGKSYGLNRRETRIEVEEDLGVEVSESGTVFSRVVDKDGNRVKVVNLPKTRFDYFTDRDRELFERRDHIHKVRGENSRLWDKSERSRVRFSKSKKFEFGRGKYAFENDHVSRPAVEYIVTGDGKLVTDKRGKLVKTIDTPEGFEQLIEQAEIHGRVNFDESKFKNYSNSGVVSGEERREKVIYPWQINDSATLGEVILDEDENGRRIFRTTSGNLKEPNNAITQGNPHGSNRDLAKKMKISGGEGEIFKAFTGSGVRDSMVIKSLVRPNVNDEFIFGRPYVEETETSRKIRGNAAAGIRPKDVEVLQFLAKFRYATDRHVARLWNAAAPTARRRLRHLESLGFVRTISVYGTNPLWVCTESGMALSGYDLPVINEDNLSLSMLPHQFTVNNTAANLLGGGVNVLGLNEWPVRNRRNANGLPVFGEVLVSESELRSSFGKFVGITKSDAYRPLIMGQMREEFGKWKSRGGVESGVSSPEFTKGNEYMWILFPPPTFKKVFHVPDLVVARQRHEDGSPASIAVEIETVETKKMETYYSTLRSYKHDSTIYERVVWVCKTAAVARRVEAAARELDMWDNLKVDTMPVLTEEGTFSGRELWLI